MPAAQPSPVPATPAFTARPNTETLFADRQGHFATDALIDGQRLRMLVDTGATTCALTFEDAERVGLRVRASEFRVPVQTANGTAYGARVRSRRCGSATSSSKAWKAW